MKTLNFTLLFAIAVALLMITSCKDNSVSQEPPDGEVETKNSVSTTPESEPADSGEVGLVINTREIFRKGYTATEAEVTFPNHSSFNETLEIDPTTSIAVLSISNEDLSEEERNAFASGIATEIVIYGAGQNMLAEYFAPGQVLDDTGKPVNITNNDLEYNISPVNLREGIPYFIQPEEPIPGDGNFPDGAVLEANTTRLYTFGVPDTEQRPEDIDFRYKYYFSTATDSTYHILRSRSTKPHEPTHHFQRGAGSTIIRVDDDDGEVIEFVLEQSGDGWVRMREAGTDRYLTITEGTSDPEDTRKALRLRSNTDHRFRLISANIEWNATDRGTEFHEPIVPPATNDFSFEATYINCSVGMVTQTVGDNTVRSSSRSASTTETLELFGSFTRTVGMSVGASIGGDLYGASADVNISSELSFSTSVTTTSSETFSKTVNESVSVSSERTIEIPPGTGAEVFDVVRTVQNAVVPFTQIIRLEAEYIDGPSLTGDEIRTQMLFNFVDGVPLATGPDYVDVGIQGEIDIAKMYSYESKANDIPDACD